MKREFQETPARTNPYALYERLKWQWEVAHPKATPAEYEAAMRRIAHECGV